MLNNFVHFYALIIAWTRATQVQQEVYLLVQHQVHPLVHLGATPGVSSGAPWVVSSSAPQTHLLFSRLHFHSYFQFLIGQILHPFAPLRRFLRAFSSAFHILSRLQSQLHLLGELFVTLLSSRLSTALSKMFTTNACIIYSAGIALYACIK